MCVDTLTPSTTSVTQQLFRRSTAHSIAHAQSGEMWEKVKMKKPEKARRKECEFRIVIVQRLR